jgi:hypothetical protein
MRAQSIPEEEPPSSALASVVQHLPLELMDGVVRNLSNDDSVTDSQMLTAISRWVPRVSGWRWGCQRLEVRLIRVYCELDSLTLFGLGIDISNTKSCSSDPIRLGTSCVTLETLLNSRPQSSPIKVEVDGNMRK